MKRENLNPLLVSEVVKSLSDFIKFQKTETQKANNLPLIAYLSTFLPKLRNKEAQICLFEQLINYYKYLPSMLTELLRSMIRDYDTSLCNNLKILCLRLNLKLLVSVESDYKHFPTLTKLFLYLLKKFQEEQACSVSSYYHSVLALLKTFSLSKSKQGGPSINFTAMNEDSLGELIQILRSHKNDIYDENLPATDQEKPGVSGESFNLNADIDS